MMILNIATIILILKVTSINCRCRDSVTKVNGKNVKVCSTGLIFQENFNSVNTSRWFFENTMGGGGNEEFQWYPGYDARNCFTSKGILHLAPTTTASIYGENYLKTARVQIPDHECTWAAGNGCDKQGSSDYIINPIRSTRMDTRKSFSFKFGTLEVRAKMCSGDWLWPAIWLLPKKSVYGGNIRSGEIDLVEMRGNKNLIAPWGVNVGSTQFTSVLHFGPESYVNGMSEANFEQNNPAGFDKDFHVYKMVWTPEHIKFYLDNVLYGTVNAETGFWNKSPKFASSGWANPWIHGSKMAPFDEEFYIILNLAVGGNRYFAEDYKNSSFPKPWSNSSPRKAAEFWEKKDQWLPTWKLGVNDNSHLQIDYVKVYAL